MAKVKTKNIVKALGVKGDRADDVRKKLLEAAMKIEHGYIDLALFAYEADKNEFYKKWGYSEFEEYAEKELHMKYRKLKYFIKIGKKVSDLNLPKEKLEQLGWSKVSAITAVLKNENAEEWIEKAETMSVRELVEAVKVTKQNDPNTPVPKITTITLKLTEAIAGTILDAIETAKKLTESDNQALALEMICSDWLEAQDAIPVKTSLDQKIKYMEKVYDIKVEVVGANSNNKEEIPKEEDSVRVEDDHENSNETIDLLDDLLIEDNVDKQKNENTNSHNNADQIDDSIDDELKELLA